MVDDSRLAFLLAESGIRQLYARYADAVVKVGLSLGRGDYLLVTCQPAHREFAVALVEAGYRA